MTERQDAIKAERRRRNTDALGGRRRKLAVTGKLDTENFEYRWANDEGTRLHELTVEDDWEVVKDRSGTLKIDGAGTGAEVAVPVGVGETGKGLRSILLRKPRKFYEDDKRAEQRRIDETEAGMKQGVTPGSGQDAQAYVPRGGIVFETGKG
jgi:hypothetical protein